MSPLTKIHVVSASIALMTITTFWVSTVVFESVGSYETIASVKSAILGGMVLLVPSMAIAGATGAKLGKGWRLPEVARKSKRMKIIAANGLLVLLPSAIFLALRAQTMKFDAAFNVVQVIELVAGATNITLLVFNMKDGVRLGRRRAQSTPAQT